MKKKLFIAGFFTALLAVSLFFLIAKNKTTASKESIFTGKAGDEITLFSEAERLEHTGDFLKAYDLYKSVIEKYPSSSIVEEARYKLDDLNLKILFSPIKTKDSVFYEVKPGDTLIKIAKEYNTTVELIKKSNGLASDMIFPGKKLKLTNSKYSIFVDKSQNILILKADNEVLKTYKVSTGVNNSTPVGEFTIINKLVNPTWYKAGAIVSSDSPENILGTRWLGLDALSYGIHGTTDESTIGIQITQGCVRMKNKEVEELYSIVPINTKVTIID